MEQKNVRQLSDGVWAIDEGMVRAFLVKGETGALLIDTGVEDRTVYDAVNALADLPLSVVNTHCDFDHMAENGRFGTVYMHTNDQDEARNHPCNAGVTFLPVHDGFVFDLGGRTLEVLETPGHTPGSVMLLDRKHRLLFSGDEISLRTIYMIRENGSFPALIESLERIRSLSGEFDRIFPNHGECPIGPEVLDEVIEAAGEARKGMLPEEDYLLNDVPRHILRHGRISFYTR